MESICHQKCLYCTENQTYILENDFHGLCYNHCKDFVFSPICIHCRAQISVCRYIDRINYDNSSTRFCTICTNTLNQNCPHSTICIYCMRSPVSRKFDCGHPLCNGCNPSGCRICIRENSSSEISNSDSNFPDAKVKNPSLAPENSTLNPVRSNEYNNPDIHLSGYSLIPPVRMFDVIPQSRINRVNINGIVSEESKGNQPNDLVGPDEKNMNILVNESSIHEENLDDNQGKQLAPEFEQEENNADNQGLKVVKGKNESKKKFCSSCCIIY